jgi:RNA polymerase primary sigma factor/RNA polymerase sigma factor
VLTVEELAKQFNVSTKTISRWRELGLVSRRLVFDGRKRVGFLRSSVDRFVKNNHERVARGARFSQLTDEQRRDIIDRARRLASAGGCQSEISRRLAKRAGRSVETIRSTIRQFDRQNPELAIFPDISGPLTEAQKTRVYQAFRRGTSVDRLTKQFGRTKTTIYRVIANSRMNRIATDHPQPRFARKVGGRPGLPEVNTDQEGSASVRFAAVFGEPVRDAALDARAGSAPVPQV